MSFLVFGSSDFGKGLERCGFWDTVAYNLSGVIQQGGENL
jgi:hypothetical protein